jgi:cytochrome bd ubiquinol oxidase subunit II
MEIETLAFLWYCVFITAVFAYAALDGFDIGVGCLHIFAKNDLERRIFLNSIGPVWDGNSLWVIIAAGGFLAGFPPAFAALFSTLYVPALFLVTGYIIRAVAIEFRSQLTSMRWRNFWDLFFSLASYLLAIGFGVLVANLIHGLPLDKDGALVGGPLVLFSPYALTLGVFTTLLFMLHGALFLNMKTEGELQERIKNWIQNIHLLFFFLWSIITIITLIYEEHMTTIFRTHPLALGIVFLALTGLTLIPKLVSKNQPGWAFLSSFLIIASFVLTYALGTFPYTLKVIPEEASFSIYNSSASQMTLEILLTIACFGVPLFLFYAVYAYKVFRGKVQLDTMSY